VANINYEAESAGIGEEAVYILENGELKKVIVPDDDTEDENHA